MSQRNPNEFETGKWWSGGVIYPTLQKEPLKRLPILGLALSTKRKRINSIIKNINFVIKAE